MKSKKGKKEKVNSIMILSSFILGIVFIAISVIQKEQNIFYGLGIGLVSASMVMSILEVLTDKIK